MDLLKLKESVEAIEMPEAVCSRIRENTKAHLRRRKQIMMKKRNGGIRHPAAAAAVLALCIILPVGGLAAGNTGVFRDIIRGTAVIGQEYHQATGDIQVCAGYDGEAVTVTAIFLEPDKAPFSAQEALTLGKWQILNAEGSVAAAGTEGGTGEVVNGRAVMQLVPGGLAPGAYILRISSFIGSQKADQDLPMYGVWEMKITVP